MRCAVFLSWRHKATHVGRNARSKRRGSIDARGASSHDASRDAHSGSECARVAGPANDASSALVSSEISTPPDEENPAPIVQTPPRGRGALRNKGADLLVT